MLDPQQFLHNYNKFMLNIVTKVMICLGRQYFFTFVLKFSALERRVHPPSSKNKKIRLGPTLPHPPVKKNKNIPTPLPLHVFHNK